MSTLLEAIASLERRRDEMKDGGRPFCTQEYSKIINRLAELRQRQLNHENMQVEIAKHLGWIEDGWQDSPSEAYGDAR